MRPVKDICPVHRTVKVQGVCRWCAVFDHSSSNDDNEKLGYDKKTGLVAKPTRMDEHVASYEDPWALAFFQPYMDFQPAPDNKGFVAFAFCEVGELKVRGDVADANTPDVIGELVFRRDGITGEQTVGLRFPR